MQLIKNKISDAHKEMKVAIQQKNYTKVMIIATELKEMAALAYRMKVAKHQRKMPFSALAFSKPSN